MTILRRGILYVDKGIDITVKSSKGLARMLAPSWYLVLGYKNGTISEAEYTTEYTKQLQAVPDSFWHDLALRPDRTLLCFCRGAFCHTELVIDYAVTNYPELFRRAE